MAFIPTSVLRRAFLRSRLRGEGLLGLEDMGEASLVDLARVLGADVENLRGAFLGNGAYKVRDSLVCLGLVESREVAEARLWRLTALGRAAAVWWRGERDRAKVPAPFLGVG